MKSFPQNSNYYPLEEIPKNQNPIMQNCFVHQTNQLNQIPVLNNNFNIGTNINGSGNFSYQNINNNTNQPQIYIIAQVPNPPAPMNNLLFLQNIQPQNQFLVPQNTAYLLVKNPSLNNINNLNVRSAPNFFQYQNINNQGFFKIENNNQNPNFYASYLQGNLLQRNFQGGMQ